MGENEGKAFFKLSSLNNNNKIEYDSSPLKIQSGSISSVENKLRKNDESPLRG